MTARAVCPHCELRFPFPEGTSDGDLATCRRCFAVIELKQEPLDEHWNYWITQTPDPNPGRTTMRGWAPPPPVVIRLDGDSAEMVPCESSRAPSKPSKKGKGLLALFERPQYQGEL